MYQVGEKHRYFQDIMFKNGTFSTGQVNSSCYVEWIWTTSFQSWKAVIVIKHLPPRFLFLSLALRVFSVSCGRWACVQFDTCGSRHCLHLTWWGCDWMLLLRVFTHIHTSTHTHTTHSIWSAHATSVSLMISRLVWGVADSVCVCVCVSHFRVSHATLCVQELWHVCMSLCLILRASWSAAPYMLTVNCFRVTLCASVCVCVLLWIFRT